MQTIEIPQDTELTIEWLKERATRPEGWAYTEAIIRPNSYGSAPLPQDDEERGKRFMMAMGGWVRYIFHDSGVIEVEYISGGGIRRNLYVDGQESAMVFTDPKYYGVQGDLQQLTADWRGAGLVVKDGYTQVLAYRPAGEDLPEAIARSIGHGSAPGSVFETEIITADGVWRTLRRRGEVIGSSFTPTATYVPNEPLRQY